MSDEWNWGQEPEKTDGSSQQPENTDESGSAASDQTAAPEDELNENVTYHYKYTSSRNSDGAGNTDNGNYYASSNNSDTSGNSSKDSNFQSQSSEPRYAHYQVDEQEKKPEEKKKEKKSKETPTPEPTEAPAEETPTPEATIPEPAAEAEAPATQPVVEYKDATTVRIVQQTLNNVGYNCGNPDGVPGGKTTEAITKYQTDKGITVNGLVTDELLQSLNIVEQVQEAVKAEGSKAEYSSDYTYDQLARNPDTYKGQKVKIKGKVLQADVSGDTCYARIAMNSDYNTVVFVTYDKDLLGYRLLDDDIVTVYGSDLGTYSYEAVSGASITLPWLHAAIIEM